MTVMIGARWQVTLAVREVIAAPPAPPSPWQSWFAPPPVEEIAARHETRAMLAREREGWQRDLTLRAGGMVQ